MVQAARTGLNAAPIVGRQRGQLFHNFRGHNVLLTGLSEPAGQPNLAAATLDVVTPASTIS